VGERVNHQPPFDRIPRHLNAKGQTKEAENTTMILMALHTHGAEKLSATALVDTVSSSGLLFLVIQQWVWNESLSLFAVEE